MACCMFMLRNQASTFFLLSEILCQTAILNWFLYLSQMWNHLSRLSFQFQKGNFTLLSIPRSFLIDEIVDILAPCPVEVITLFSVIHEHVITVPGDSRKERSWYIVTGWVFGKVFYNASPIVLLPLAFTAVHWYLGQSIEFNGNIISGLFICAKKMWILWDLPGLPSFFFSFLWPWWGQLHLKLRRTESMLKITHCIFLWKTNKLNFS